MHLALLLVFMNNVVLMLHLALLLWFGASHAKPPNLSCSTLMPRNQFPLMISERVILGARGAG